MNLNKYKVFDLIERENRSLFFREISKKSGVSIGGVQKVLGDNEFFFEKVVRGRNTYYSIKGGMTKRLFRQIVESERAILFFKKNPLLKDFFEKIIENKILCLVFGSYASFSNKKGSDLDLLVVDERDLPEHLSPVEPHILRVKKEDFSKSSTEKFTKEIKRNHILIYGFDYFMEVLDEKN